MCMYCFFFFFQAEDGIRDVAVTGVQTCALPIFPQDAYTASKGGVLSLTRSLAVQYGRQGVRANAICPGPILTPMLESLFPSEEERLKRLNRIPLGRFGRTEDIVYAGIYLSSDESSWTTGTTV